MDKKIITACPMCKELIDIPEIDKSKDVVIVCPKCGARIEIDHKPVSDDVLDKLRNFLGE